MKLALIGLFCALGSGAAMADEAQDCQANAGHYVTGTVQAGPSFVHGHYKNGIELSHTRLTLLGDDGINYDVRIDNVFAVGYDQAGDNVPAPLSSLKPGDKLDLCGKLFTTNNGGEGMDWVHTSCGATPRPSKPDGWVKLLDTTEAPGANLEASSEYCSLWP
jgi:hypothetical protein